MSQLAMENLSIGYGGNAIINDISLEINKGEYICIVGENGAGKSTFMKTVLGLIPPVYGSIKPENMSQTDIGYLPQQTQIQRDFPASVWEVVCSGLLNKVGFRPFYSKSEKDRARKAIENLGITALTKKSYNQLSGGQQQRVLLARALCATNEILLLDEPGAGLDPQTSNELYSVLRRLNDQGITIIMISHDIDAVAAEATRVIHFGKQMRIFTSQEYKEYHEFCHLCQEREAKYSVEAFDQKRGE